MLKKLPRNPRTSMMMKDSVSDKCSRNTSGTAVFSQKSESSDFLSSEDVNIGNNSQNLRLPHSHTRRSNEFFSRGDSKDLEENSSSQRQAEPSECSVECVGSSLAGPVTNNSVDGQKSLVLDSASIFPNSKEAPLLSQTSEGSDILEDDVKVCDICGDAGREEMLAICSRCSDGAEHTYCMRIMLDKVPEGDWLCEECQLKEDAEKQKLDKTTTVTATPKEPSLKEKSSGVTLNPKPKLDSKADEAEVNKDLKVIASSLLSAKRHAENLDDSSKSRKLAIDTSTGAPGIGTPRKKPALSREDSFKSMDVGKEKQANLVPSSGSQSANNSKEVTRPLSTTGPDSSRMQAQLRSPRGLLSRSATFNNLSSKPKIKQLLEDAFQKQNVARESSSSVTRKEGLITKSMSFRMPSSSRSNMLESKSKMLSSKLFRAEDSRGLKQAKEQNLIERKNSFKLDRPVVSSSPAAGTSMSLPKADPKSVIRGESISSIVSVNNSCDPKTPQRDGKLNSSNSANSFAYKGSENVLVSDGCGEVKKQSSCLSSGFGIPISKGKYESAERKPYQVGPKEDAPATSCVADESCSNPDLVLQDGLPGSHESTKQDGKTKVPSAFSLSKLTMSSAGKNIWCRRCNEVGHIAQFCTASSLRVSALKASAAKSSGEVSNKSSKWKDAVEAISRTRQKDIRLLDQSDELSMSSTDLSGEVASKDQLSSSSSCVRNLSSPEGTFDGQEALRSSTSDSSRTTAIIHVKQQSVQSTETVCAPEEANSNAISTTSDEFKLKPYMMKMSTQASVNANPSRISAIPEHDYIWKGGFEVLRSGRFTYYCDGIQAHMSTCASQRVIEVVKKFPCKVRLEEVPRLSSWPMQFQGKATEDNIAIYFFAKDLESYERNYKKLLDNMVRNDLALKGNVDGIELLIFPSNQLPEKSQCWNRLIFLWAVFRERRVNCLEFLSGSQKKLYRASLDLEPSSVQVPVMAKLNTSQKTGSYGEKDKELSGRDSSPKALETVNSTSVDLPFLSSSKRGDGNCCMKASSLDQKPINFDELNKSAIVDTPSSEKQASCSAHEIHSSASVSQLTSLHDGSSLSSIPMTNEQIYPEVKCVSISLKEVYRDSKSEKDTQFQSCVQPTTSQNGFHKGKLVTLHSDTSNCRQAGLTSSAADTQVTSSVSSKMHPVSSSSLSQEAGAGERLMDNVSSLEAERQKEPTEKEQSSWESRSSRKRPSSNLPETISETSGETSKETIQTMVWKEKPCLQVDGENNCKKMKSCNDTNARSISHEQIFGDGCSSKILDLDPNFLNKEQKSVFPYDNTVILENSRTTERYLFPVDSGHVRDLKSGNSIPWQILSDDEDFPESDVPNLELALGAEKKQSKQVVLPLFGQLTDDKNNNRNKLPVPATDNCDDDLSASLSLSLSFPFSGKEQAAKSVSKTEQLLPKRHHVNTSLLLFGGLKDT